MLIVSDREVWERCSSVDWVAVSGRPRRTFAQDTKAFRHCVAGHDRYLKEMGYRLAQ
jgi:hypothetical protein